MFAKPMHARCMLLARVDTIVQPFPKSPFRLSGVFLYHIGPCGCKQPSRGGGSSRRHLGIAISWIQPRCLPGPLSFLEEIKYYKLIMENKLYAPCC